MKTTITTTARILKALSLPYGLYDNYKESWFTSWCQIWCREKALPLRAMITHDGLRNWYHDQWNAHVDKQFLKDNSDFLALNTPGELQDIYFTYPEKLMMVYPKVLFEMIKEETHGITEIHRAEGARVHA